MLSRDVEDLFNAFVSQTSRQINTAVSGASQDCYLLCGQLIEERPASIFRLGSRVGNFDEIGIDGHAGNTPTSEEAGSRGAEYVYGNRVLAAFVTRVSIRDSGPARGCLRAS